MAVAQKGTLKRKLTVVIMLTSIFSLLLAGSGFIAYELLTYRDRMVSSLTSLADIIGANSTAALAFENREDAEQILQVMKSRPRIMFAGIYDKKNKLFARYQRPDDRESFPDSSMRDGVEFSDDYMCLTQAILLNDTRIGTIVIQSDLEEMRDRFRSYIQITIVVLLGTMIASFLLATKLQERVSKPIMDLTVTAKQISYGKDYSVRALHVADDEIGVLSNAFNEMLSRIENRETVLLESEKQFRLLFASHPLPMWVYDRNSFQFLEVNESAETNYGYTREEFLKMKIMDIRPLDEVPRLLENIEKPRNSLQFSGPWKHQLKNGRCIDVEIVSHQLNFSGHDAVLVVALDITERQRAEEALRNSENRYRSTLDHMMEGCQIIGYDWRYLYLNDVAARQGRRAKEELLGHTMMEMYPGIEKAPFFTELRRCMEERIPHRMENEFLFPDGSKGWFNLNMEPVPEGVFILAEDITKEKELNEELRKHREHLEDLVTERTGQLQAANKELEMFSYSVSHDLRSPLRAIEGFSRILLQDYLSSLDTEGRRLLNIVRDSTTKMAQLIDDLLAFSKVGRADLANVKFRMTELVTHVFNELKGHEPDGRDIHFVVEPLPDAQADRSMIKQVWVNLISNAIKFTRKKEQAVIRIGGSSSGEELVYFIQDNGAGFDMRYADKLFGVFQRLHRPSEFEGTGVGLAIVQRIVHKHGGSVRAESNLNEGTTITFTLPNEFN